VKLIAQNVSTTQPLAPDGHIELAFDRLLLPSSPLRQTFILADVRGNLLTPTVAYDPVARVVTITPMAPLDPGQRYQLAIASPKDASDPSGLHAIDGALLDPSSASVIEFVVSAIDGGTNAGVVAPPTIDFCNDVLPGFRTKCSSTRCHGGSQLPAAGLLLDGPENVAGTALGRVAQGANTGPRSTSAPAGRIFGINMPIVDTGTAQPAAGNPANSWLMYKLLLAVPPACSSTPGAAPCDGGIAGDAGTLPANVSQMHAVAWTPMTDSERAALSDLVPGREMPFPARPETPAAATTEPMTVDELERVSLWIAQGARVPATCP
jgi:hypothetical protein